MFNIFRKKKKAFERDVRFYDDMYKAGGHIGQYHVHYTQSRYFQIWSRGAQIISSINNPRVFDIGCGPGQFAQLLFDNGIISYKGIDHSSEAIKLAKKYVPQCAENFTVADVFEMDALPENYDFVTMFEVLEHLERDFDLLRLIPSGTKVLFSVPSYGSASHVRQFKSPQDVKKRYNSIVDIILLEVFTDCPEPGKTIFLVYGKIKPVFTISNLLIIVF